MMKQYTFAVVGALGNVGTEMRGILETSDLPIANLVLLDILHITLVQKSNGVVKNTLYWNQTRILFSGVDIAIMSGR